MIWQRAIFASCLLLSVCSQAADVESPAAARKREMAKTRAAVMQELETAGGDWRAWYERVKPAWTELDQKINEGLKDPRAVADPNAPKWSYLHTAGTPSMFVQVWSAPYLMAERMDPDEFLKPRPSVQVLLAYKRWLEAHHVDLIFVPVPKLVQVYPERILKNAPSDRILAPHMRKLILQLLDEDVEVIDLLPEFLKLSASGAPPLYLPADSHWSQMTQKLTAHLLAQRLARYPFVQKALKQPPKFKSAEVEVQFNGSDYGYLKPEEQKQVEAYSHLSLTQIQDSSGQPYQDPENAPLVMIGDSYVHYFSIGIKKGTGIAALLSREVNLPVTDRSVGGGRTESLREFFRDPELLDIHKVVIWIISIDAFMAPTGWDMPPFPPTAGHAPK